MTEIASVKKSAEGGRECKRERDKVTPSFFFLILSITPRISSIRVTRHGGGQKDRKWS